MKNIIAFGASSSKNSINKTLALYGANKVDGARVELLDLNDYEMPIYSEDREKENGIHALAHDFKSKIDAADGIVVSFAEHNGNVSAAFKNIYDWVSRIDMKVWQNKPMLVMASSPGARGGQGVLGVVLPGIKRQNKNTVESFSLPQFHENFKEGKIINEDLELQLSKAVTEFEKKLLETQKISRLAKKL